MEAPQKFWTLTGVNVLLGFSALSHEEMVGSLLGVLLLALAAFTAVIAWRSGARA